MYKSRTNVGSNLYFPINIKKKTHQLWKKKHCSFIYNLGSISSKVYKKRIFIYILTRSYFKTMSIRLRFTFWLLLWYLQTFLGFLIDIKKTNFVKDHLMIIHVHFRCLFSPLRFHQFCSFLDDICNISKTVLC